MEQGLRKALRMQILHLKSSIASPAPKATKKQMPNAVNVRHHLRAFAEKKLQTKKRAPSTL